MRIGQHETHPAADALPLMDEHSLQQLADSIEADGLERAIVLVVEPEWPTGRILDGRNRYMGSLLAGVEPRFEFYDGPTDRQSLALYVERANLRRRDLTFMQRTTSTRRLLRLTRTRKVMERFQRALPLETPAVDEVLEHGTPELVEATERGDVPVDIAAQLAKLEPEQQRRVLERMERVRSVAMNLSAEDVEALKKGLQAWEAGNHKRAAVVLRKLVPHA